MAIYFDARYHQDMRDEVKAELLAVAEQSANSAKAAERERCAKIAETQKEWCDDTYVQIANGSPDAYDGYSKACCDIAAKIRSGE